VNGRRVLLRPENFVKSDEDDQQYFDRIYGDFKHREAQEAKTSNGTRTIIHDLDYEDVPFWPYEWIVKVETEYYFRYEGTQLVPPCWETVHWRLMKDPIRVPQRQIDELNRLLAWRLSPTGDNACQQQAVCHRMETAWS
jgi:Eukaryotic-type carbonic anhydrase